MATRDPVLDELRRSMSLTASSSRKTNIGLAAADSTISLEGLEQADIGESVSMACAAQREQIVYKLWGIVSKSSIVAIRQFSDSRRRMIFVLVEGSASGDYSCINSHLDSVNKCSTLLCRSSELKYF